MCVIRDTASAIIHYTLATPRACEAMVLKTSYRTITADMRPARFRGQTNCKRTADTECKLVHKPQSSDEHPSGDAGIVDA